MNSISKSYSGFSITFQLSFKSRQQRTTYLTSFLPTLTYSFQRVWPKSGFGHDMFPHILTENGLIPKQQFHRRLIKPVMKIILISAWFTFVLLLSFLNWAWNWEIPPNCHGQLLNTRQKIKTNSTFWQVFFKFTTHLSNFGRISKYFISSKVKMWEEVNH